MLLCLDAALKNRFPQYHPRSGVGSLACLFPALVGAEPQDRASDLAARLSFGSIGSGVLSSMCGRRGVPTVRYQKRVGCWAERCSQRRERPLNRDLVFFDVFMFSPRV